MIPEIRRLNTKGLSILGLGILESGGEREIIDMRMIARPKGSPWPGAR